MRQAAVTRRRLVLPLRGLEVAVVILLLSLGITLAAWRYTESQHTARERQTFHHLAQQITDHFEQRVALFVDELRSAQGLFAASKAVERDEFSAYFRKPGHPGIRMIAFVKVVPLAEREAFMQQVRADVSLDPAGYPDFTIHPSGVRDPVVVTTYLEPMQGNERALGFDWSSEPIRREALERSRDSGELTLTERVPLLSDPSRSGVLFVLPLYDNHMPQAAVEERRAAVQGFVVGVMEPDPFFRSLFAEEAGLASVMVQIFDGDALLFQMQPPASSSKDPGEIVGVRYSTERVIGGRRWTVVCTAQEGFHLTPLEEWLPRMLLISGTLISLLLFGILAVLATSRRRAVRLAEGMTQAWRTNQELLMARTSQQTAVAELSQQALTDVDLSTLFDYAVSLVAKTLHADLCEVLELLPGGTALQLRAGVGWPPGAVGQATGPADPASQAGYTLRTSGPVVVEDLRTETRFTGPSLLREQGVVSGMSVVIPGQERPFGVLGAHLRSLRRFGEDDVQFLQHIANVLAVAIHRKRLESVLRDRGAELEQSLAELQATQLQLIQSEKLESVGRLAAGVAHEVKNPLAVILMGTEYLTKRLADVDGTTQSVLRDMSEAVKRADRVIKGLLDFSASRELEVASQALRPVIDQALLFVKHALMKARVTAEVRVADDVPPLMLDQQKMEQVFVNLFTNAVHAMPEGGTLTVTAGVRTGGDEAVVVTVEDTGAGIPPEKLTKIFDPFFTTKPTGQGTGLGLTVVRKIIELHGGAIDAANRPEGGVRVTMRLPVPSGAAKVH